MAKNEYIERLKLAVEKRYNCRAEWIGTGPVKEVVEGKTIWEGSVETFVLMSHSKAKHAYAWKRDQKAGSEDNNIVTALGIQPVDSPQTAVKLALGDETAWRKRRESAGTKNSLKNLLRCSA